MTSDHSRHPNHYRRRRRLILGHATASIDKRIVGHGFLLCAQTTLCGRFCRSTNVSHKSAILPAQMELMRCPFLERIEDDHQTVENCLYGQRGQQDAKNALGHADDGRWDITHYAFLTQ